MSIITQKPFGLTSTGKEVTIYKLSNNKGESVSISSYGACIVSVQVKDNKGELRDVVLGYDSVQEYEENTCYFGAFIGRCGNRIKAGKFKIDDIEYQVSLNEGDNHLHGGINGFNSKVYNVSIINGELSLTSLSPDGEEGYPGNLEVEVRYNFTDDSELVISYFAKSDKDTVVNLTNHSYFNLDGHKSDTLMNQILKVNSDYYTVNNSQSLPTGELKLVEGTPFDFREFLRIGEHIDDDMEQLTIPGGYDQNMVLRSGGSHNSLACELYSPESGISMSVYTNLPGIQVYSGNYVHNGMKGKDGAVYNRRAGICLETQYFPDAINHSEFKSPLLKSNELSNTTTIYKFSVK